MTRRLTDRPRRCLAFVVVCGAAWAAVGSAKEPADAGPDQSTPKAAVTAFWSAIDRRDAEAASRLCVLKGEGPAEWVAAFADMCDGFHKLHGAAFRRFGAEAEKAFAPHTPGYHAAKMVDRAEVAVDGETAVLTLPKPNGKQMGAVRRDGRWLLDLRPMENADLTAVTESYRKLAAGGRRLAAELDAGEHETLEDAVRRAGELTRQSESEVEAEADGDDKTAPPKPEK